MDTSGFFFTGAQSARSPPPTLFNARPKNIGYISNIPRVVFDRQMSEFHWSEHSTCFFVHLYLNLLFILAKIKHVCFGYAVYNNKNTVPRFNRSLLMLYSRYLPTQGRLTYNFESTWFMNEIL
jgi:hypothetical protein